MRQSLITPIESRDGTLAKDCKLQNFVVDPMNPAKVMKRPSTAKTDLYAPSGQGFGLFTFNDYIYLWTDQTPADYPAIYDYVPDYWNVDFGGGYIVRWENDQEIVEVPEDVYRKIEIGSKITISGVSPSGYNGTCLVVVDKRTSAQMGVGNGNSILITNLSNPGDVVNGGVAKKLQPCASRPAFPKSLPQAPDSTITPSITESNVYGSCGAQSTTTTTWTKVAQWFDGDTNRTVTGTEVYFQHPYDAGCPVPTRAFSNDFSFTQAMVNDWNAAGASLPDRPNVQWASFSGSITYSDSGGGSYIVSGGSGSWTDWGYEAAYAEYTSRLTTYNNNKTAWDAMCCP